MADLSKITLPNGSNYNLKDLVARTIEGSMTPIESHTWTGVTTTANTDAAGFLYFAKLQPTNYYCDWVVEYRVHATMAGISDANGRGEETSYVYLYGTRNSLISYKTWNNINNTGYRPYYHHALFRAKQAGIDTNHKGHALGLRLYSSYNPDVSTYARTIQIDVLYKKNCTITWIDPMVVYASLDGTGSTNYDGRNEYDGITQGETHTGDRNDQAYYVRSLYTHYTAGSGGIKGYSFILQDNNGTWQSVHTTNATTATNKEKNPVGFRLGQIYYMASGSNIAAGTATADSTIEAFHCAVDGRYSFNIGTGDLTGNKEVYLVGELHSDGLFYLDSTWWTQTEPSSNNGKVYIPVGYSRLSGANTYQIDFRGWRGAYWYKNGCFQEVVLSAVNATSINGKTAITGLSSTGGSGLQITKSDDSTSTFKVRTQDLVRPTGLRGLNDSTLQTLVSTTRANRLAFLPADQIIIEQTIDGGTTWTDAGVNNAVKLALFSETRPSVYLPRINDTPSLLCGIRITFTAMKYNVPDGTPETEKYNYWSSEYVKSAERYCQLKELYFWLSATNNSIGITVQRANGATPNNWINLFNDSSFFMTGWSGCDYVSFSPGTFGGGTTQTGQPWNYRITLMTKGANGTSTMGSSTNAQSISEIRGYGDMVWTIPNQYMANDHMYSKDTNQNVTFPAQVTATNFAGKINNHTVNSDVPSNAVFTDTKDLTQMTGVLSIGSGGTGATTAEAARTRLGFGDAGSTGNPVYFDDGLPVAGTFTWGVDADQNVQVGWDGDAPEIVIPTSSALPINQGGTGATTAAAARTNLGLGSASTYNVVSQVQDDSNLVTNGAVYRYVNHTRIQLGLEGNLLSKTYTGIIGTANTVAGASFYAIKVLPDSYNGEWSIRYRITAEITGVSEANGFGHQVSDLFIQGMRNTYATYWVWNDVRNTSYRPFYYNIFYRAKEAGVTNGYGHIIGVGLRDSWNRLNTANPRTITVEVLDYKDCTVSLFDSMVKYENAPGTGSTNYEGYTELNGTTQGLTRSGSDSNTYDRTYVYGAAIRAESAIVAGNIIVAGTNSHYHHLKLGTAFDITYPILYANSAIDANTNSNSNTYISIPFTVTTTQPITLTAQSPVFIKGQLSGTIFTPVSTTPLTQIIPSTADGYEYILLGQAYSTTQLVLAYENPVFAYRNGKWRMISSDVDSTNVVNNITTSTEGSVLDGRIGKLLGDLLAGGNVSFVNVASLDDLNSSYNAGVGKMRVAFGVISKVAYISFDVEWIRVQFKVESSAVMKRRNIYGGTIGSWLDV